MQGDAMCGAAAAGPAGGGAAWAARGGAARVAATLVAGLVVGLMTAGEAAAQRADTRSLTCRAAQDLIQQSGAVTLSTGANTFDRFVANSRACGIQGRATNTFVSTSDNPNCRLQTCRSRRSSDGTR